MEEAEMHDNTTWLRAAEAAKRFPGTMKKEGVCRLARLGILPPGVAVYVGHKLYINSERLEQWLASGGAAKPAA
jgi:hypothetical protein